MVELDFDRSEPPVMPARDEWIAKYKQLLSEEETVAAMEGTKSEDVCTRKVAGLFASSMIVQESCESEESIDG